MKNFLFLFLCFPFLVNGQNWNPISLSDKYNYQIDTSEYINNTVWVDSINIENGDSVFYLNRIVIDCPACDSINGYFIDGFRKIAKQQQFLQERIIKKENGLYCFRGESNFCLKTSASFNESWLFDTLQNIEAIVIESFENEIFGNLDSLKTILLSNNDTILLSKNHGIIKFQAEGLEYNLIGIEGKDVGELVPDFWDIYNFDVGDVFQYEGRFSKPVKI